MIKKILVALAAFGLIHSGGAWARRTPNVTPSLSISDVSVNEAGPYAIFTITKNGKTKKPSSFTYKTSNGTATAGQDYTGLSGSRTLSSGQNSITISIPITQDSITENPESFYITLTPTNNATCSRCQATGTIIDDDPVIPPPPPSMTMCPDGTMIPSTETCPAPPSPTGWETSPSLQGYGEIPTTDHDVMKDIVFDGSNPGSSASDLVGAFRFLCGSTNIKYDDPIVYPGNPGASHLHDQTGNTNWDGNSTYTSLRQGGGSRCNDVEGYDKNPAEANWAANRTPYWQPALLDGKGNVIQMDWTQFYYKRRTITDPVISDPSNPFYQGHGVDIPRGLKFIFGASVGTHTANTILYYQCVKAAGGVVDYHQDFHSALVCAQSAAGNQFYVRGDGPSCWDGQNLDSPDHRSHMSYPGYGSWGYLKCDAQHPYVIPFYTYIAAYTILPSDDASLIKWSSDDMDTGQPHGWSIHVDYGPMAWDPIIYKMFTDYCINALKSCTGGQLGNGYSLKGAGPPIYRIGGTYQPLWLNPNRLVPVPAHP